MRRASEMFTAEDRARINRAIVSAESKTSAEILAVVATDSGRYDRAEDIFGLWLGLLCLAGVWFGFPTPGAPDRDSWSESSASLQLVAMIGAVIGGFVLGSLIAGRIPALRRLCTPRAQLHDEVAVRARSVFFDKRVHHTAGASGLLIYVSLFERVATVLGDQTVVKNFGEDAIQSLCTQLTTSLATLSPTEALCATIETAGEQLALVMPRERSDANELVDALVTID
ncbi:MAG: hypothetical protein ACKVX7_00900 [Planctomycetota bacterium]